MPNHEELLQNKLVKSYLETHLGAEQGIKKAAEVLAKEKDAAKALVKLLPALTEKVITVFFSYKKKDEETAEKIIEQLNMYSSGKLQIIYMASLRKKYQGQTYHDKIKDSIRKSNWFILLFPDPKDDWDWCLFETGLFAAQYTSADRLICLHHPPKKPKPIEEYNMVSAEQGSVEELLEVIFLRDNPIPGLDALNPAIRKRIPAISTEIVNAISKPKDLVREIYEPWVEMYLEKPRVLKSIDELDKATVGGANQKALDIFRLLNGKPTWGKFRSNLSEDEMDTQWLNDLCYVIFKIANGHKFYPVQSVFQNSEGKMYRPVVCAVDRDRDSGEIEIFHLTFIEDVASVDRSVMPKDLSVLANVLRSTFRFRWEVLEKFGKGPLTDGDVGRLKNALTRIQQDWDSKNVGGEEEICNIFTEVERQNRVKEMFAQWYEVKNDELTGILDIAIKDLDTKKIPEILESLFPINTEFLDMAADRFAEIVTR